MMEQPITISDNCVTGITIDDELHLANLRKIAENPIRGLKLDNCQNLLIFPRSFDEYGDKIGDEHIFEVKDNMLFTGNIMGFVGYGGTKVRIHSRFASSEGDFFLHYMLRKVLSINLFDLKFNTDNESIFDFLIYFFPLFLKNAIRQGLYKEYQTRRYNDANVKGRIDINRHIRQNLPFAGNVAYTTREYAYDNHVTQLIRHTIEYISCHPLGGGILQNDDTTRDAVDQIKKATPSFNRNDRRKILNQNLRPLSHPYYNEYRNLQQLCVQILRHEELSYGQKEDEIYGILFDGAWLWEEYLNTFLHDKLFHPRNKTKEGELYLFTNNTGECYPDFYNKEKGVVLDAKYKGYANWGKVQNADIFQVIAYMHIINGNKGGFIVPVKRESFPFKTLEGRGGTMHVLGMAVDYQTDEFKDYCQYMEEQENKLSNQIKQLIE